MKVQELISEASRIAYDPSKKAQLGPVTDWMDALGASKADILAAHTQAKKLDSYEELAERYKDITTATMAKNGTFTFERNKNGNSHYMVYANGQIRTVSDGTFSRAPTRLASKKMRVHVGDPVKSLVKTFDQAFKEILSKRVAKSASLNGYPQYLRGIKPGELEEAQGDGEVKYSGETIMVRRNSDSTFTASVRKLGIMTDPYTEFDDALDDAKQAVDADQSRTKKDVYGDDVDPDAQKKYDGFKKRQAAKGVDVSKNTMREAADNETMSFERTRVIDNGKKYKITWEGYHKNPKPETHPIGFFADDNGFSKHDRSSIMALEVGEEWHEGGPSDSVTVKRVK